MNKDARKVSPRQDAVRVSGSEREILREIIKSEKANVRVFNLSDKQEQIRYERALERLDGKFA